MAASANRWDDHGESVVQRPLLDRRVLRSWPWLVGLVVLGAVAGAAVQQARPSTYVSTVRIDLAPGDLLAPSSTGDRQVATELLYLTGPEVARAVQAQAPGAALDAAQVGLSNVVQVSVSTDSEQEAVRGAEALLAAYTERLGAEASGRVESLQNELSQITSQLSQLPATPRTQEEELVRAGLQGQYDALLNSLGQARVQAAGPTAVALDQPADNVGERSPSLPRGGALGALLGCLLALAVIAFRRRTWRVEDVDDVVRLGERPLGPQVPGVSGAWVSALPGRASQDPVESAARLVAGRLLANKEPGRPVVLQSVDDAAAGSVVAVNVATALARETPTVLLCAADAYERRVARWFAVPDAAYGLADLKGEESARSIDGLVQPTAVEGLYLLPAGSRSARQVERAEDAVCSPDLLSRFAAAGWRVVVDAPPICDSAVVNRMAGSAPVVAVVATVGRTPVDLLHRGLSELRSAGLAVEGVVVSAPAPVEEPAVPGTARG
ncbi:hypothetical protein [Motilibacter aurantiacus]|uniref:hypothetical protein n=1 Tax=Motilibacter aurantiacus TaxID=2714955 RepID=UPI00140B89B2|nr:hypothetical protein [Motilibacter aurantiacus]NHC44743.1 hypothetical protein [Motilibacter aurantiacus]